VSTTTANRDYRIPESTDSPDLATIIANLGNDIDTDVQNIVDDAADAAPVIQVGTAAVTVTSSTSNTPGLAVTFPTAFASVPKVFVNMDSAPGSSTTFVPQAISITTTGFRIYLRSTNGTSTSVSVNCSWMAVVIP
jgi:hypothetical protein